MLKNLGWAYLELGNYQEAQNSLQKAIHIKSDRAAAYCLQAKVLEKQQNQAEALLAWGQCFKYFKSDIPDEQKWINEAVTNIGKILQSVPTSKTSRTK